jgi:hypothetical protein
MAELIAHSLPAPGHHLSIEHAGSLSSAVWVCCLACLAVTTALGWVRLVYLHVDLLGQPGCKARTVACFLA